MDLLITVKDRTFVIPDWVTALIVVGLVALSSLWGDTEKIDDPHLLMCDALSVGESESESEFVAEEQSMSMMDNVQVDEKCFVYDDEDDNDDHHHEEEDDNSEGEDHAAFDDYQA